MHFAYFKLLQNKIYYWTYDYINVSTDKGTLRIGAATGAGFAVEYCFCSSQQEIYSCQLKCVQ